ncbi:hypothetical protein EVAR_63108_1 [Eumeta japonica]|uniref:Uncharacterized protein n=1 Tax=Eumeta variegata TaxID=151549 RepID=A0A4C1ZGA5_EUMVA|nr:hypothetical protein EVAR_63108_1 [Eumeta japonica]
MRNLMKHSSLGSNLDDRKALVFVPYMRAQCGTRAAKDRRHQRHDDIERPNKIGSSVLEGAQGRHAENLKNKDCLDTANA